MSGTPAFILGLISGMILLMILLMNIKQGE
jgi:hypothetical protein